MDVARRLAARVGSQLEDRGLRLVTAESCTGGGVAHVVTSVPGSSVWFDRGFVTYSDASKRELLGVSPDTLDRHGAVGQQGLLARPHQPRGEALGLVADGRTRVRHGQHHRRGGKTHDGDHNQQLHTREAGT